MPRSRFVVVQLIDAEFHEIILAGFCIVSAGPYPGSMSWNWIEHINGISSDSKISDIVIEVYVHQISCADMLRSDGAVGESVLNASYAQRVEYADSSAFIAFLNVISYI